MYSYLFNIGQIRPQCLISYNDSIQSFLNTNFYLNGKIITETLNMPSEKQISTATGVSFPRSLCCTRLHLFGQRFGTRTSTPSTMLLIQDKISEVRLRSTSKKGLNGFMLQILSKYNTTTVLIAVNERSHDASNV